MWKKGKLKTTKWVVKFDVLKAENVAQAQSGFDGRALGSIIGILGTTRGVDAAGVQAEGIAQLKQRIAAAPWAKASWDSLVADSAVA